MYYKKVNLLDMDPNKLSNFFCEIGENPFRAQQVMRWIYQKYCDNFNKMTNLSKILRIQLHKIAEIQAPVIQNEQVSVDGTKKWIMKVGEQYIETVYIPDKNRATLCLSSQVGCALNCSFCGTAQQGFNRNLKISEIIGQVWTVSKLIALENKYIKNSNTPITHIAFMGMGEPLLNLTNVVAAIKIILSDFGFALSKHHVTVSTAGIIPGIDKLKNMIDVSLAISLHAPNDLIRSKIMPINKKYSFDSLFKAINRYLDQATVVRKQVTIEYVLLNNINNEIKHAHELAQHLIKIPCKVNLISWNPILYAKHSCSTFAQMHVFRKILLNYGIVTTIRKIRGIDINAACGQLIGKVNTHV